MLRKFLHAKLFFVFSMMGSLMGCTSPDSLQEFLSDNGQAPVVEIPDGYQGGSSVVRFSKTTGDQQNAVLGSPAAVPLKITLLTSAGLPDAGKTIFFAVVGGATYGSVSSSTVTTEADGTAQVTFTAGSQTGAVSVLASTSGLDSLTFTVNVAGVSVYEINKVPTNNGNGQTGNIGSTLSLPFKVVVTDSTNGSAVQNVSVRFLATQGTVGGSFSGNAYVDILTDQNGIATSPAMTLNTTSGSHTVRAFLVGSPSIYTDFSATGAVLANSTIDPVLSTLTLSSNSAAADGSTNITATVRVKDQYGNLIPNNSQTISLSTTPTTTGNNIGSLAIWDSGTWTYVSTGTYTRTMSVNTEAGSVTFDSLSISGVSVSSNLSSLTLTANNTIDPSKSAIVTSTGSLTANGITTATIIVTLKDFFNNQVSEAGHSVIISTNTGTLSSTTLSYHAGSGTYRAFYTTPTSVGAGSVTFTLNSVNGTPVVGKTANIVLTPGPLVSISFATQPAPLSINTDTAFSTQPVVRGYDVNSNLLTTDSTSTVVLSAYDGIACTGSVVSSGLGGVTTLSFSSGSAAFTNIKAIKTSVKSIKATLGSLTTCSDTLTVSPGVISSIAVTTQPAPLSTNTDSGFSTQPVITAYDANGNILTNNSSASVSLAAFDADSCAGAEVTGGISGTTTLTLSAGVANFTNVKAVKVSVKSIRAAISSNTACISGLTISAGAPTIAISSGNASSAAHGTAVPPFYAVVQDANGNPIANSTVNWTVVTGGGTLSSSSSASNSSGISSSTLTTGIVPGVNTVRASLDSSPSDYVTFSATGTTSPSVLQLPFTAGTSSSYMPSSGDWLTSTLEMTGGVCKLISTDQTDNTSTEFDSGTYLGVNVATLADNTNTGLKLANNGGCNGTITNCTNQNVSTIYELNSSWTPQWGSLLSYYKMDNNWNDSKGSFNGTAQNGAVFTSSAKLGSHAGSFDGVDDKITFGNFAIAPGAYTIMFWAKRNVITIGYSAIFNFTSYKGIWGYQDGRIGFGNADGAWNSWNGWTDTSAYHHIAIVVPATGTSAAATLYFDGVSKGSITVDTSGTWNNVGLGGWAAASNYWPGSVDELAIWTTGLTAAEVGKIYDRQSVKYSGVYSSRIMDAKATGQSWTSLSWVPTLPFFKALPDYASGSLQNETSTDYTSLVGSTGSTGANNLMQNLVGLWHLDEPAGTSGSGSVKNNAGTNLVTTPGSATVFGAEGKLNKAAYFDGTGNSIITTAYNNALDNTGSFTVSAWIKITSATGYQGFVSNMKITSPWSGYFLATNSTGTKLVCNVNYSNELTGAATINDGVWHHVMCVSNGSNVKLYVDGVQDGNTLTYAAGSTHSGGDPLYIGTDRNYGSRVPTGWIDEVAIWNRALHENEIKQLYQRGASRLKFQVRSCDDAACSGETWQGPDGTSSTYFSELFNVSAQSASPPSTVTVKKDLPSMTFSSFTSPPSTNRYFQYRTIFESDTANTSLMPELKSVTVAPVHYDTSSPWVYGKTGVDYYSLSAFTETLGSSCAGGIGYNLGVGATAATATWYWWDSSKAADCSSAGSGAWCAAGGTVATSNSASDVHTNRAAFGTQIGTGKVYVKAFLKSNGSTPCELDNVQLDVEQ